MRLATWNVNSIRTRVDRVTTFLRDFDVDVLAMQEIKCRTDQFPYMAFEEAGYEVAAHGLNQWNGVAIASRVGLDEVATGFPGMPAWDGAQEARAIGARVGFAPQGGEGEPADALTLWSLYIPNGRELEHPHYAYKLAWLEALRSAGAEWLMADDAAKIALVGDWNVAPQDGDVWSMDAFAGKTHVSAPERAALRGIEEAGFREVTREFVPEQYTYWDYQQLRFPRNEGMRIDFVHASPALSVSAAEIVRNERKGKGASDHVPVIVEIP